MIKIDCKQKLLDLKGDPIKDSHGKEFTFGEGFSEVLIGNKSGGKMKMLVLAEKFYKEDFVELDDADFALLKSACESTEVFMNNLVPGRLLVYLESLKDNK